MKIIKILKIILCFTTFLPIIFSIIVDIATYNVIFPTDDNIFIYIIKGIIFNWEKWIPSLLLLFGVVFYENKIIRRGRENTKLGIDED